MIGMCSWEESDDGEYWETECGNHFVLIDGTPTENNMKFCCFCGNEIAERHAHNKED